MAMSAETKARRAQERAYEKRMSALKSIAHDVKVIDYDKDHEMTIVHVIAEHVSVKGMLRDVNPVLEKLGYRPVRITHNMLNTAPDAPHFCIDINTPAYCDPGCESYHSM